MKEVSAAPAVPGSYPAPAIPVGVIKSSPCPASLLAAVLLGEITGDLGVEKEPKKSIYCMEIRIRMQTLVSH